MIPALLPAATLRRRVILNVVLGLALATPAAALGQSSADPDPSGAASSPFPARLQVADTEPTEPLGAQRIEGQQPVFDLQASPPSALPSPIAAPNPLPTGSRPVGTAQSDAQRLDELEKQNREMQRRLTALSQRYEDLLKDNHEVPAAFEQLEVTQALQDEDAGVLQSAPTEWPPGVVGTGRQRMEAPIRIGEAYLDLEDGVTFVDPKKKFRITFHDLTQFDVRMFSATGNPLVNNFAIPRQRLYFLGELGENWYFYSVLNRGYGTLDLLDSFAEYRQGTEFHMRIGRYKVPFCYEYFKIDEASLLAGERSVFVGNLNGNRELGVMAYGRLFDERFEYAIEGAAGSPHDFYSYTNSKMLYLYTNSRPFLNSDIDLLKQWNVGAAYDFGFINNPLFPNAFHTANDASDSTEVFSVSPTFLMFNSTASEVGIRSFWTVDSNWYYKNMTAQVQYNGGYITYQTPIGAHVNASVHVPYSGYSLGYTYFLTGEEITSRKEVKPLKDFKLSNFMQNTGAVELFTRWANLTAGQQIYSNGLVNPALWSRSAVVLDNGFHWYPNRYVRITTEYQFSQFSSPVQLDAGSHKFMNQIGMFWFRTQLFY